LLTTPDALDTDATLDLICHKQVPLKVFVLAWRLLRNRVPTKDNLAQRNIISHDSQLCVTECGGLETAQHLFLSCHVVAHIWGLVRSWIGVSSADPVSLQDHFLQFIHFAGGFRARRSFVQLVWLCCISVMWTERNNRVFKATEATTQQMLDKVKLHSLWWLKTHHVTLGLNSHRWWSSPFVCMGID
jgi:hypothetical protein